MAENRPIGYLTRGAEILGGVLRPHGFRFRIDDAERRGSGGLAAAGSFRTGDRRLELHFRNSLGLVTYHVGDTKLSHEDYMRSLGVHREAAYPGFSANPLAAFAHLAADLERFCRNFVSGDGSDIIRFATALEKDPGRFRGLP